MLLNLEQPEQRRNDGQCLRELQRSTGLTWSPAMAKGRMSTRAAMAEVNFILLLVFTVVLPRDVLVRKYVDCNCAFIHLP